MIYVDVAVRDPVQEPEHDATFRSFVKQNPCGATDESPLSDLSGILAIGLTLCLPVLHLTPDFLLLQHITTSDPSCNFNSRAQPAQ